MNRFPGHVRNRLQTLKLVALQGLHPVQRADAHQRLLLVLGGLAGSVLVTRGFLSATGYPQVGGSSLHIAHLMWGGIVLFIAALLVLLLVNRWAGLVAALLTGVGFGLFIDEVGKFVTRSNDYFFLPAAPLIFVAFAATLSLLLMIPVHKRGGDQATMLRLLEDVQHLVDQGASRVRTAKLAGALADLEAGTDDSDLKALCSAIRPTVAGLSDRQDRHVSPRRDRIVEISSTVRLDTNPRRLRWIVLVGLGVLGLVGIAEIVLFTTSVVLGISIPPAINLLVDGTAWGHATASAWYVDRVAIEGAVRIPLVAAAVMMLIRRDWIATSIAQAALLLSLVPVDVFVFYVAQFRAAIDAVVECLLLLAVVAYRRGHVLPALSPRGTTSGS